MWSYILLINTAKRPPSKLNFLYEKKNWNISMEKSYCSPKAANHAHWCVSEVSATILIDSQAHPPHRQSESTDFSLIPGGEWAKSHDQKVDRAIHCISTVTLT